MKKIFLISEYILPEQNTTGYLFDKLHSNLKAQYGDNVKLIVKKDSKLTIENAILVDDVNLNKKKIIQRFLFELIISLRFLLKILLNVKKGDVVFSGTTPILLLPVIFFAKKIKKFKWILLVHDVFPENLIAAKVLKENNYIFKILKKLFDVFYGAAEKRIVIGQDMKILIDSKVGKFDSIVIQNWIDHDDILLQSKFDNDILKNLNWQNSQPVLSFFGNIGRVQGIHNITDALSMMEADQRPYMLFIGDGAYKNELNDTLLKLNDPKLKYIGPIDPLEKSNGLNACDISIVTLAEGMYGLGVPSKAYYAMAADKPILAIMDENSEVALMVKKHKLGWVVPAGDSQKLLQTLIEIKQEYSNINHSPYFKNSPRQVLIENFSEAVAMRKIFQVVDEIRG